MLSIEKQKTTVPCPGCKKDIEVTYYEMYMRKEAKCRRCSSSYKFGSNEVSNLRLRMRELDKAQDKLADAVKLMVDKATATVKK